MHTTVYTYGTLNPMLVRKLLVAYIMKIGSLKRLKSNIWCKILACLESALIQQMLDWDSVSDGDTTSSLQSSIERRYPSGSFLQKRYRIEFKAAQPILRTCIQEYSAVIRCIRYLFFPSLQNLTGTVCSSFLPEKSMGFPLNSP